MTPDPQHPRDSEDVPFLLSHDDSPNKRVDKQSPINPRIRSQLMVTLLAMVLAVEVGFFMAGGPMTRIYESIACRDHFAQFDPSKIGADGQVAEELCKGKEVQSEVAAVKGYMEFFEGILSVLLAIPYGLFADRYGRRRTLCFGIPGFVLNCMIMFVVMWFSDIFPLRAVWVSCVAFVFGGGPVVTIAILYTMMSDVTMEEERALMFFRFGVAGMGADFVSSFASSWLMTFNPWIPLLIGWGVVIVGVFLALLLPETKDAVLPNSFEQSAEMELDPLSSANDEPKISSEKHTAGLDDPDEALGETTFAVKAKRPLLVSLGILFRSYFTPYAFIFRTKQILLLLSAFLVYRLSRGSSWFLTQYISARYTWTLAQANLLTSFKPALTIPLYLLIIPAISKCLLRRMKSNQKDLQLARASLIFLVIGTLGIGLSLNVAMLIPSLIIQTGGSGFVYLARSLIATLVKREETARLFTVIEVLQAIGNVIASLAITNVFQLGLEWGGPWVGLAWFMTSTAFCIVGMAICRIGSGIAPFLPVPSQPIAGCCRLPIQTFLFFFRLPFFIFACLGYFFVLQWLPIGSLGKKAALWCILGIPSIWWVDLQVDGVRKGSLSKQQARLPGPGSIIAASFTSPIDALYLAAIFDPIFSASYPTTREVEHISLLSAILRAFRSPQLRPPHGAKTTDLAALAQKYPGRPIVVFAECTTTNGRGILPLSPSLTGVASSAKIFPVSLRYTPEDVVTPLPGSLLSFVWALLSRPTHCIRVRIAEAVANGGQQPGLSARIKNSTYDTNYFDILEEVSSSSKGEEASSEKVEIDLSPAEKNLLDTVGDSLARLGRVKRVGLGVHEKREFVRIWQKTGKV
ncbi:MFS general substrate transporter [Aspergillus cavernicola]|uniref:MFS general substrate transporter n=1 Tax=Aspergillus cavernicola TaxID=176166 RepID=A0ABR4IED8_9EURO